MFKLRIKSDSPNSHTSLHSMSTLVLEQIVENFLHEITFNMNWLTLEIIERLSQIYRKKGHLFVKRGSSFSLGCLNGKLVVSFFTLEQSVVHIGSIMEGLVSTWKLDISAVC